jgi:hypothetical protein
MMEMYLKALAARNAEAGKPPKVAPGRAKEAPKAPVAKEEPKPAPAPVQADLPVDYKSLAAGDDWDGDGLVELIIDDDGMTEVVD